MSAQAALLATVLNNPTQFDTDSTDPVVKARILDRYRYVLDGMRQTGTITRGAVQRLGQGGAADPQEAEGQPLQGRPGLPARHGSQGAVQARCPR